MGPDRGQNGSVLGWETGRRQRRPQERGQRSQSVGSATSCGAPGRPGWHGGGGGGSTGGERGHRARATWLSPGSWARAWRGLAGGTCCLETNPHFTAAVGGTARSSPHAGGPSVFAGTLGVSAPALAAGGGWGGVGAWSGFSADTGWPRGPGRLAAGRCSLPLGVQSGGPSSRQGVTLMGNPGGRWRGGLACAGTKLTSP